MATRALALRLLRPQRALSVEYQDSGYFADSGVKQGARASSIDGNIADTFSLMPGSKATLGTQLQYRVVNSMPTSPVERPAHFFDVASFESLDRIPSIRGNDESAECYLFGRDAHENIIERCIKQSSKPEASARFKLNFITLNEVLKEASDLHESFSMKLFGVKRWYRTAYHQKMHTENNGDSLYFSHLILEWLNVKNPSLNDLIAVLQSLIIEGKEELKPILDKIERTPKKFIHQQHTFLSQVGDSHYFREGSTDVEDRSRSTTQTPSLSEFEVSESEDESMSDNEPNTHLVEELNAEVWSIDAEQSVISELGKSRCSLSLSTMSQINTCAEMLAEKRSKWQQSLHMSEKVWTVRPLERRKPLQPDDIFIKKDEPSNQQNNAPSVEPSSQQNNVENDGINTQAKTSDENTCCQCVIS